MYIAHSYFGVQVDSVYKYAQFATELSTKLNYTFGKIKGLDFLAQYYWSIGQSEKAAKHLEDKLKILEKNDNKYETALTLGNMGLLYNSQSNFEKALEYYFKALKIEESLGNKEGIARNFGNIGNVYIARNELDKAIDYFNKAYVIAKEINDIDLQINNLNNIGAVYYEKYELQKSLDFYNRSLTLLENRDSRSVKGTTYMNIGNIYMYMGDSVKRTEGEVIANTYYSKALKFFYYSLKMANETGDINIVANCYGYVGELYRSLKQYAKAEENMKLSLAWADSIGDINLIKLQHYALNNLYTETKKYDLALLHYKKYISARDSIFNEENTKKTVQLEMNFEFEKKEAAAKLEQEKKEMVAAAESKKQKIIIWSICGILILVIAFAIFAFRSYLQKQKANVEIMRQKETIEEKQKEILDSIHYAKRIQRALMPSEKNIQRLIEKLSKKV